MGSGGVLTLRGLWWRRGLTLAMLAVAIVTTTAAALGPLYARAAAESTLHDQLTSSGSTPGLHFATDNVEAYSDIVDGVRSQIPADGSVRGYPSSIEGIYTPDKGVGVTAASDGSSGGVTTHLAWRQGQCQHLVITSGHCPTEAGQALVSERTVSAGIYGFKLGATLTFSGLQNEVGDGDSSTYPPLRLKVVGTYLPKDVGETYWFDRSYFDAHAALSSENRDTVDSVFVAQAALAGVNAQGTYDQPGFEIDVDFPLDADQIRLSNLTTLKTDVAALQLKYSPLATIRVQTGLTGVLAAADHQRSLVNTGTLLVTLQLGLLAWLVLFQVIADAVGARGNEIALSKLRGRSGLATVRFGLGEPLILLALAVPIGISLAVLVTHLLAAHVLVVGTPVVLTGGTVWAALAAFAGGAIAAGLAAHRTLTRSVLAQWRQTANRLGHSRALLALDIVLAFAAVAGLVALRAGHTSGSGNDSAALLAPGLLVFAVALIGVRLLPLACRALLPVTRARRSTALFLAVRQVARRPAGLRLAALLAVALGLASFAVAGESIAQGNRNARAQGELGASQVLNVLYANGHDPEQIVDKLDPQGQWGMAVASWLPDGGVSVNGYLLAVDASRFSAVAEPARGGPSPAQIAAAIAVTTVPRLTLTGRTLHVVITASGLTSGPTPDVQINLSTPTQPYLNVYAGPLQPGTHTYAAPIPCGATCTFRGLTWDRPITANQPMRGTVTVGSISVDADQPIDARLDQPGAWRSAIPQGQASDVLRAGTDGLRDEFTNQNGGYGGIAYAFPPSPLHAVAVPGALADPRPDPGQLQDASGTTATFTIAQYASVLPWVLNNGVLVDLPYLRASLPSFDTEANWQVWLGPNAPPDADARLRVAGLLVQSVHTVSARVTVLARQGPALALLLLLATAIAGAALAAGGTAISISASGRRRSYELAALRTVGVPRRALLRSGILEQLFLLLTAVVLGVPAGLVAARLAMPVIPQFADTTPIAMRYVPNWSVTSLFTGGFVVLLVLTAVLASWSLIRAAVPARLRESEQ
ncbi:MAG: FtsX-like permease family protein [Jatrophihabitantaceae bacterium]